MTYRIPYMFAGYRADFDPEFVDVFEGERLKAEAEGRFVLEETQDYE